MNGGQKGPGARLPLESIRVVDLSRVIAMPYAAASLADLGAEVIKVEACHLPDSRAMVHALPNNEPGSLFWERSGTFHTLNRGKRSLTLDLRNNEALNTLRGLIQVSDILIENYTPRVSKRFSLDYPNLHRLKPDLIVVSNTGYGHSGPWSSYPAVAATLESTHGTGAYMGYGGVPTKIGSSYTDCIATWTALFSIMAALLYRARTGRGLWIDLAMYQVGAAFIGEGLLDYSFNKRRQRLLGNRHQYLSPHGCYPCRGDDQWVVLAVQNESQWRALCSALGQPSLAEDMRYANPAHRYQRQEEIDAVISQWTRQRDKYDVMHQLQGLGIACGPVLKNCDLFTDPHFRTREVFQEVQHDSRSGIGKRPYISRGWRFSKARPRIRRPGPALGEDNAYVLRELLGLDRQVIDRLKKDQVIGQQPIDVSPPSPLPLERQKEVGWIKDYDPDFWRLFGQE